MNVTEVKLKGCFVFEPKIFADDRGYFFESFNDKCFEEVVGARVSFVQENQSLSSYGTLRGLHFQKSEFAQAKLVRVLHGTILDVAVDLREDSVTYGQWFSIELSEENRLQLYIPRGFAHGFSVLSESAVFNYKCDNYYCKSSESGIRYDEPTLNIDWKIPSASMKLSVNDLGLPFL